MHGMKCVIVFLVCLLGAVMPGGAMAANAHEFTFMSIEGGPLPFSSFKGKPVLVVNTASFCGYTYQYKGLAELWKTYKARGLVILGVPSNDFGNQEPGNEGEIKKFCEVNFGVDFPMTAKQVVRGSNAHPLYQWLAAELGDAKAPRWNFHKYLIGPNGDPVAAWSSQVEPLSEEVQSAIRKLLPN